MSSQENHWPTYTTHGEALRAGTAGWGDRLGVAQHRYALLDGELPHRLAKVTIGIVEGHTESPDQFSLVSLYGQQDLDPELSGVLLYIDYEGSQPPDNAHHLAEVMREQRERAEVPTAIAFVGYGEKRRIDRVRANAWDVVVAHVLLNKIAHPVLGISNDADTVDLSTGYSMGMTEHDYVAQPGKVWGSEVAFSQPGGSELPLHKVLAHLNGNRRIMYEVLGRPVMYGGSLGLTLETYVTSGGWTGTHTKQNPYGISEPSRLILNAWERLTGERGSMDNTDLAYRECARRVNGLVTVSPRREILEYYRALGTSDKSDTYTVGSGLSTEITTPYRRLSDDDIAELAASIDLGSPAVLRQLEITEQIFLDMTHDEHQLEKMKVAQQVLRDELGLSLN